MNGLKRILVVDDEEPNRSLLEAMLDSFGYKAELAGGGAEALDKLNSNIDLVLLDVLMPGLDGLEVTRRIRNHPDCGDVPIVIVTALTGKHDRLQAITAGANDFISKPIDRAELQVRLASLLKMKDAQEALRQSEEKYRTLVEAAKDVIWTVDLDLRYTYVSPSVTDVLGYTVEEIMAVGPPDVLTPESRERVIKAFQEELTLEAASGPRERYASRTEEIERCHKDGSTRWEEITTTFLRDRRGKPIGILGISHDISDRKRMEDELREARDELEQRVEERTGALLLANARLREEVRERQQAEDALRDTEQRLELALAGAELGLWDWYVQTDHAVINKRSAEIVGYELDEIETRFGFWESLIHPEDRLRAVETVQAYLEGSTDRYEDEYRVKTKSGELKWMFSQGKIVERDLQGRPLRMAGTYRDITGRKKTEAAFRASEERYRGVFENAAIGIDVVDAQGRFLQVNGSLAKMLGYSQDELLNLTILDVTHPADIEVSRIKHEQMVCGEVLSYRFEKRYVRKDGELLWADVSVSPVRGPGGGYVATVGVIGDITDRKRAEEEREHMREQLVRSQKMEAIGTLTGGIAHDFNNLLTVINGYTEMILSEKTEDDASYSDLQKILQTGRKGAELVQRLLVLSKKGEISPQPLDLNTVVENSVALMGRTFPKTIEIETILEKDLSKVTADDARVEQVLMNLGINAKEAMPEGGRIRIETSNAFADEDFCRLNHGAKPGRHVLITISDTGNGMSKETMDRMFDPFFTTKGWDFKKGTGLGLSVAKGIVEQHGGRITCESELGKGTTFRLYFPIIEESTVDRKPESLAQPVPGERILLVDDEDSVRDLGKRFLDKAGYTAITARNGKEALEIYAREQSSIGLVVLDLIMPQMGGEQCLEELLRLNPHVKVVVSSGHSLSPKERDLLGAHAKGLVDKPYQRKQFLKVVREVLDAE